MRTGLLSDLSVMGCEIFLEDETICLRYRKPGSPPDTVKPLIDELRKHKAEVVNILKMGNACTSIEKLRPGADVTATWPKDQQTIINWFMTLKPPREPFDLEPHRHIIDPEKFFAALRMDINAGPDGARGKHGALLYDLLTLKKILH